MKSFELVFTEHLAVPNTVLVLQVKLGTEEGYKFKDINVKTQLVPGVKMR